METARLQAVLRELDNRTLGTGRQVLEINKQIGSLCAQAEQYRNTADRILARVSGEDDAGRSADMVSQAYAYISRAEYCEASAGEMQSQADTLKGDLQVCGSESEAGRRLQAEDPVDRPDLRERGRSAGQKIYIALNALEHAKEKRKWAIRWTVI